MARKIIEDLKVNKLSKELYDQMVANGTITPEMIEEQAWLFTDQAFISEDILKEIKDKEIPTKLSEFQNDTGFITESDIPKNLSEFNNDANFATADQIPTDISELNNDIPYARLDEVPTKVSELINDSDFASRSELPTKLSELINDDNYAKISNIPTKLSELENDVPYAKKSEIPVNISELNNDSKYATIYQLPTKVSDLTNDLDFASTTDIPTDLSQLNNDVKYIRETDNISKLTNDAGYLNKETDPTVPAWAKEASKPTYTKAEVGLSNVDNKSSATIRSELTTKNVTDALGFVPLDESVKGVAGGVATLGVDGTIPSSQLPSYVDDVVEYDIKDNFPVTGEAGKIYIDCSSNTTYRWSGTRYTSIGSDVALGETSSTAYPGDKGKIAYDHAKSKHAPSNAEENVIDAITVNGTIQPISNKTAALTVPTKISELVNDAGYSEITDIPTKLSELVNDVPYAKTSELPTDLSQLNNDEGFITSNDVPTKVSELANDVNYVKSSELPADVSEFNNDVPYAKVAELPTKLSELTNDANYIQGDGLPTKLSELENDVGFLIGDSLPTKLSELTNDTGFITESDDITGNAATASKLQQAINIQIKDHDNTNMGIITTFDGSSNTILNMPSNFKGTLHGNIKNNIDASWLGAVRGEAVVHVPDTTLDRMFNPLYSMRSVNGAFVIGGYRIAADSADRRGINIVYFKNETIDNEINDPDYLWNFGEDGSFNPNNRRQDIGRDRQRWNKVYSNTNISNMYTTTKFGIVADSRQRYRIFCKIPKRNTSAACEATFLLAGAGDFGGAPGSYLIAVSNRTTPNSAADKATMNVTCLQPFDMINLSSKLQGVRFGYYADDNYFYFGLYQNQYSYQCNIICISREHSSTQEITVTNILDTETEPNGWTEVEIKYSVAGADTVPIGTIVPYAGETLRDSYVVCDGRELNRIVYGDLFKVIGTLYGAGDGSTTFNVPDLRHRVPIGKDTGNTKFNVLGKECGEETHTLSTDEMPSHGHDFYQAASGSASADYKTYIHPMCDTNTQDSWGCAFITPSGNIYVATNTRTNIANSGGSQAHNNIQPSLTVNYMIKVKAEVGVLYPIERSITNKSDHHLTTSDIVHQIVDTVKDDILKSLGLYTDTYSSTKTYKINDLVVHNKKLYACKTAIATAEAWNESHWTRQSILNIR